MNSDASIDHNYNDRRVMMDDEDSSNTSNKIVHLFYTCVNIKLIKLFCFKEGFKDIARIAIFKSGI
jgi:hypothetical protein